MRTRQFAACGVAVALGGGMALADTVVPITGIGTQVGIINTHVDSVTYSDPVVVEVANAGPAYEIHGTVSGVGWGGSRHGRAPAFPLRLLSTSLLKYTHVI